ncbi:osomolarity two-component sensor histidine kinase sln1 [Phlyctema vagabunda]|uniref:histidine kinase n=1 Tax=Phlyctema vagabunda TaxID=108571 RepID=A0ABR4PGU0_9HELO
MRIPIREQLALLVLTSSLVALLALSVATWVNNRNFVVSITTRALSLTASLKAAQISADLLLLQATCSTIVTRILLQEAIRSFYHGNLTAENWTAAGNDVAGALASGGLSALLQVKIFSKNLTGDSRGILNSTAILTGSEIELPLYTYPNGTHYMLGDSEFGYPPPLYPNITYRSTNETDPDDPTTNGTLATAFSDFPLNDTSLLFLGPLLINDSYALVSLTLPIVGNGDKKILAYMTVVAAATSFISVTTSREGLGDTGVVLLVGPNRRENLFRYENRPATVDYVPDLEQLRNASVKYVFPPAKVGENKERHIEYKNNVTSSPTNSSSFTMGRYPAVVKGFSLQSQAVNNASSVMSTKNENGDSVAVGFARPSSNLVDWLLVIEQAHSEAWRPIQQLRKIILACVFGTIGFILLVVLPVAHYSVRPIRRLRDATEKSIAPPGYTPNGSIRSERMGGMDDMSDEDIIDEENFTGPPSQASKKKNGFLVRMKRFRRGGRHRSSKAERTEEERRRAFKIPGKVKNRKHWITDELTELTTTFNEMTDELMLQYSSLEDKVQERTAELEISKKAAEAANESKTLFIANISHELKTPLNGILGMCAVCMGEDDLPRIKKSLQVVYKSGDLLLHLLNDLLTFSKNQIGQQLSLEEKEFRLSDVKTQLRTIFDKQIREGKINFSVKYLSPDSIEMSPERQLSEKELPAIGPNGLGRLKDMCLWGDQHRILQVIINLVSNSLKFTPEGGMVAVRIKCLGEAEPSPDGSRNSMGSKDSSRRGSRTSRKSRNRHRNGSGSNNSQTSRLPTGNSASPMKTAGTALLINPMDPKATPHVQVRERSPTPPPPGARTLVFEFEVEDTGPGIPEHLQQSVFEPFVQADLGLSKKYGGTGLGLSICSQLATLMGGNITLESTLGKGSSFKMKIPLKFVKERAASTSSMGSDPHGSRPGSRPLSVASKVGERSPSTKIGGDLTPTGGPGPNKNMNFEKDVQPRLVGLSQPFFASAANPSPPATQSKDKQLEVLEHVTATKEPEGKLRVLVAEDNLVNQEVVLRMLKLEDIYDVVVAKDGQEAYDMVKQSMDNGQFFNLIFMDIQMPNLDGLQSTRLIRQMGYSAPIVALTAFAEESNVKECYDSGMDMFLSKPIRRPALKQVLKKFATIPEESETVDGNSITRKSTPEKDKASPKTGTSPSDSNLIPTQITGTTAP